MGIPLLDAALQRVPLDDRIVTATVIVSVVALLARFLDPLLPYLWYAGLLGGFVNGLRTGEWEFASTYGALPGLLSAFVLTAILVAAVPLGVYTFPFDTLATGALDLIGPVIEFHVFAIGYTVEGWLAFAVTRKVTGPNFVARLRSDAS